MCSCKTLGSQGCKQLQMDTEAQTQTLAGNSIPCHRVLVPTPAAYSTFHMGIVSEYTSPGAHSKIQRGTQLEEADQQGSKTRRGTAAALSWEGRLIRNRIAGKKQTLPCWNSQMGTGVPHKSCCRTIPQDKWCKLTALPTRSNPAGTEQAVQCQADRQTHKDMCAWLEGMCIRIHFRPRMRSTIQLGTRSNSKILEGNSILDSKLLGSGIPASTCILQDKQLGEPYLETHKACQEGMPSFEVFLADSSTRLRISTLSQNAPGNNSLGCNGSGNWTLQDNSSLQSKEWQQSNFRSDNQRGILSAARTEQGRNIQVSKGPPEWFLQDSTSQRCTAPEWTRLRKRIQPSIESGPRSL